jgi:transcriptional regulator with XRE-family HTH domain
MKTAERIEARRLRQEEGLSMKQIARRLGVSLSSVSLWVRDIELDNVQQASLRSRAARRRGQASAEWARAHRRASQENGRRGARRSDPLHIAGCMLFWAEGGKERNAVVFTNSDPEMVRFFARFLRECFAVSNDRIKIACNLFADHVGRMHEIEDFWLEAAGLPRSQLRKSIVNVYSKHSKKKRRNRLPHGTCRLVVNDTALVQSIYGAIQEYAGFERPEWLG